MYYSRVLFSLSFSSQVVKITIGFFCFLLCFKLSLVQAEILEPHILLPRQELSNQPARLSQTVRGTITDSDSKLPLIGATIIIPDSEPLIGAATNENGVFRLENIAIGRITIQISYLGYETKTMANIEVTSGKEVVLDLSMLESSVKMDEVVVKPDKDKGDALNEMALISARSISTEETKRYSGGWTDPARLVSNFAGVTHTPDGGNDITIRGNSPKYIQWRMEGVEISNPYHMDDQNSIGGEGISVLNNNLLTTSDFFTGAFSAEYGDVLSGVYDVKLKTGNNEKFEAALGVGLLGIDFTVEGPFKKDYAGSYLFNYRYSISSLINDLGLVDADGLVKFQDATFKIVLPTKSTGTFSFFGVGGLSGYSLVDVSDLSTLPGNKFRIIGISKDIDKRTYRGNIGMNHILPINSRSYIKTSLYYSSSGIDDNVYQNATIGDSVTSRIINFDNNINKSEYRAAINYNYKLNAKNKIQLGTKYTLFDYNYFQRYQHFEGSLPLTLTDFKENIGTLSNFISWKHRLNRNITLVAGLHNMNVFFNNKSTLEPRLAVNWVLSNSSSVHAGYGKHSTIESVHNYYTRVELEDGSVIEPNRELDLLKANHYVLGYKKRFSENLLLKIEAYYQDLYNLPVENLDTSYFATINEDYDYRYVELVNKGTGKNYGLEFTFERFFANNYYYLINVSLFNSKYKSLEGVERNTKYNNNYLVNILAGKEFEHLGKKNNQTIAINTSVFFGGGRKIIPLLRDSEGNIAVDPENNQFWDYKKAYEKKLDDIFQLNLSFSYRFNGLMATHEISIDLMNLTNNRARIYEYYDETEPGSTGYLKQFPFFPNLLYRYYF